MQNISTHISYKEATRSEKAQALGLDNTPNEQQLDAMRLLASKVFEPLRDWIREPILVTSFFRSAKVNKAIGGSDTSDHVKGCAMDIKARAKGGYSNADLFHYILENLDFDQLIWELGNDRQPAWVHVSYRAGGNRKQVLRAVVKNGKTSYEIF